MFKIWNIQFMNLKIDNPPDHLLLDYNRIYAQSVKFFYFFFFLHCKKKFFLHLLLLRSLEIKKVDGFKFKV